MKIRLTDLLLVLLIIYLLFLNQCGRGKGGNNTSTTTIDTTVVHYHLPDQYVTVQPSKPTVIIREIPAIIDTPMVIADYYSQKQYSDSVHSDTVSVWVRTTLERNALTKQDIRFRVNIPMKETTIVRQEPHNRKVMVGAMVSYEEGIAGVGATVMYQDRRDRVIFGSYDPFSRRLSLGGAAVIRIR